MYLGTLAFIGECKKWGLNEVPVNDFMKKKLAEGKWNVHRMVREVEDKAGWDSVKAHLVERAKVEPIIGMVYLVSDKLNKAVLSAIIDDARNTVKPVHLEVIVAPVYDWDWQEQTAQVRNAWITSAKFCNDLGFDKHLAVLNTCTPPLDKNYVGKEKLWFVKQMMNSLKVLLPPRPSSRSTRLKTALAGTTRSAMTSPLHAADELSRLAVCAHMCVPIKLRTSRS